MRPVTLVCCLGVVAVLVPPLARADLVCPAPVFQAGQLNSGKTLVHQFALVNPGPQVVEVSAVKPGCGCLKALVDRKTFAPGATGLVTVEIQTVTQAPGPNTWKATVHGTQAGVPFSLPLFVQATLTAELSIQP